MRISGSLPDLIRRLLPPPAFRIISKISEKAEICVFGGVPRDFLFHGHLPEARDFDFVIEFADSRNSIADFIPSGAMSRKNRYGGWKLDFEETSIDIWELKDTWAFREGRLPISWENLLKSVYLNTDAFACRLPDGKFVAGCDKSWPKIREIDIVMPETPFEDLNLCRAIIHAEKYGLRLSEALLARISARFPDKEPFVSEMIAQQLSHYGKAVFGREKLEKTFSVLKLQTRGIRRASRFPAPDPGFQLSG